ncbi:MAG: arginine--tRNA ligase [Planctomycetota bacterium]|nr:MAG: arginine--tRNA ligase [Planctomycetota bacterium]
MNTLAELRQRFSTALLDLAGDAATAAELAALVLPSQDPKFGDYQANCAMPLGKRLGKPPREVAAALVERLDLADLCEPPQIAGPGFINLTLRDDWIVARLQAALADVDRLGVQRVAAPRTFVLDYSSPNVAKPMHVGHIRSTVIGDALYRMLRFVGHKTISDNHIGDWGTQFGMIIYGWKHFGDEAAFARGPVAELSRLYRLVNTLVEYHEAKNEQLPALRLRLSDQESRAAQLELAPTPADPADKKRAAKRIQEALADLAKTRDELADAEAKVARIEADEPLRKHAAAHPNIGAAVLAETAALHAGDAENRALWQRFLPPCLAEIDETYRRLDVSFDHTLGESFYEEALPQVVRDLAARGLARESHGAQCVFLEGHDAPFLIQKQDGAFLYATTDLATIRYRMDQWRPDAILYVVDHRQSLHFTQLFATARLWGYEHVEFQHISFGTVLGDDGKPFKTRSGASVGLASLLDEAVDRAHAIVCQNDDARPEPLLSAEERRTVAERVGIGAIKYADLAHNRTSDYKFSYDKMLAMQGNTAAYMQYSYARVSSIFDKGSVDAAALRLSGAEITLTHPAERALALALLQFSEALDRVLADYRPNLLTDYLYDVASRYAAFFESCPVLRADTQQQRESRLLLCDLTARTLRLGLNLLGIAVVDRM